MPLLRLLETGLLLRRRITRSLEVLLHEHQLVSDGEHVIQLTKDDRGRRRRCRSHLLRRRRRG